ncbi:toxin-activating lysine-acyltransferase [Rhodobacter capsulatus]|uniref:toxin-activating lysine-acyltransferase n=1 Tax=Rhodobacter capsulatus TaxID=1061 RepID=UPI0020C84BCB|nr:toxin-activating lysine-acyltransferase [Rhodobacter capsulatus]WER11200.1 toxin-activating lysine-acyltransferase [Rhodobacter capsulatus]
MVSGGDEIANGAARLDVDKQPATKPVDPVAGKTVAEILGEIVWLMTQDPAGREMKVAEIEALVMPAILARRFHIRYAQVPEMRRPGATTLQPVEVRISAPKNNTYLNENSGEFVVFSLPLGKPK